MTEEAEWVLEQPEYLRVRDTHYLNMIKELTLTLNCAWGLTKSTKKRYFLTVIFRRAEKAFFMPCPERYIPHSYRQGSTPFRTTCYFLFNHIKEIFEDTLTYHAQLAYVKWLIDRPYRVNLRGDDLPDEDSEYNLVTGWAYSEGDGYIQ